MNYRHIYHAGGFADVFKHIILTALLQSLRQKDSPFCFIDSHAGTGRYDLQSIEAQKTQEFTLGIGRLMQEKNISDPTIQGFLDAVNFVNPENPDQQNLRYYPGSPRIARYFLRPQDKMILSELHPDDVQLLKQEFHHDKQVAVHQQDGYLALKAFLPPKEKRGLVLIDPPYEKNDDIEKIYHSLEMALKRWNTGIYAVWYPIKEKNLVQQLYQHLKTLNVKELLQVELSIYPNNAPISLNGSGVAIINPPWQFAAKVNQFLPWLWKVLSAEKMGSFVINTIEPI